MLGEFIEASVNFTTNDVWEMYAVIVVVCYGIMLMMYASSKKD